MRAVLGKSRGQLFLCRFFISVFFQKHILLLEKTNAGCLKHRISGKNSDKPYASFKTVPSSGGEKNTKKGVEKQFSNRKNEHKTRRYLLC